MKHLRHGVFWPPFLLLIAAIVAILIDGPAFLAFADQANRWILHRFGWLFNVTTLAMVGLCLWITLSPLGQYRIGGADAKPLLTRWRWFSIVLCTTVAVGVLFWATAEPLYHLYEPPGGFGLEPGSAEAARFAMSTLYLHWTFTPYAIYTVPALMFALVYYNMRRPFSLGSTLTPLFGRHVQGASGQAIDAVCLYALVAGMAASLGTGIKTIAGGLEYTTGIEATDLVTGLLTLGIVAAFLLSSVSGLMKGVRILSDYNTRVFFLICGFMLIFGPTAFMLSFGSEGLGAYLSNFFTMSLYNGSAAGLFASAAEQDDWPYRWSIFYWSNWMAWAPVTALFLGRIGYGYTVREFVLFNWIVPALFGMAWMMIFGGAALHGEILGDLNLYATLQTSGPESVLYAVLGELPLSIVLVVVFLLTASLSYITAADSNTSAMGGISSTGVSPESPEPSPWLKIIWGGAVGFVAWFMISQADIEGIKMISRLGGLPALILTALIGAALARLLANPVRYLGRPTDAIGKERESKD